MAPKICVRRCVFTIPLLLLFAVTLIPSPVLASTQADPLALSNETSFAASVSNGIPSMVVGAYAEDLFALPIVQQPEASAGYVSTANNTLTQFRWAEQYNVVGLLAHNFLSGRYFSQLWAGQRIDLVYGDGRIEAYRVTSIYSYRATDPLNVYSNFVDLDTNEFLSAEDILGKVYTDPKHVTLQTCIERDGNSSWGRLFVIAVPEVVMTQSLGGYHGEIAYLNGARAKVLEYQFSTAPLPIVATR